MEMELESIMLPGIDPQRPIVIAGPCSAETEEQVMESGNLVPNRVDSKELVQKACNG